MSAGQVNETGRILVICAAGLRRFMPALGALASIRASHVTDSIVLLTHPETAAFAATTPYFNEVWSDDTVGSWDVAHILNLRRRLNTAPFARVYDLDCDAHSTFLFRLLYGFRGRAGLPWSGTLPGTALAHTDSQRAAMHIADRWAAQLKRAGIPATMRPDLSWIARHVRSFNLPFRMTDPFVLLALSPGPGQESDWSEGLRDLAGALEGEAQQPVLVDLQPRPELAAAIASRNPKAVDLTGKATLNELVLMAWAAAAAVGTDNGIMHLTAAAGCRTVVLYDGASDPALVGQRGGAVTILRRPRLKDIPVGEVLAATRSRPKPFARQAWDFS